MPFAGALWSLDVVGGAVRRLDPATLEELAVYQLRDASAQVLGVEITASAKGNKTSIVVHYGTRSITEELSLR